MLILGSIGFGSEDSAPSEDPYKAGILEIAQACFENPEAREAFDPVVQAIKEIDYTSEDCPTYIPPHRRSISDVNKAIDKYRTEEIITEEATISMLTHLMDGVTFGLARRAPADNLETQLNQHLCTIESCAIDAGFLNRIFKCDDQNTRDQCEDIHSELKLFTSDPRYWGEGENVGPHSERRMRTAQKFHEHWQTDVKPRGSEMRTRSSSEIQLLINLQPGYLVNQGTALIDFVTTDWRAGENPSEETTRELYHLLTGRLRALAEIEPEVFGYLVLQDPTLLFHTCEPPILTDQFVDVVARDRDARWADTLSREDNRTWERFAAFIERANNNPFEVTARGYAKSFFRDSTLVNPFTRFKGGNGDHPLVSLSDGQGYFTLEDIGYDLINRDGLGIDVLQDIFGHPRLSADHTDDPTGESNDFLMQTASLYTAAGCIDEDGEFDRGRRDATTEALTEILGGADAEDFRAVLASVNRARRGSSNAEEANSVTMFIGLLAELEVDSNVQGKGLTDALIAEVMNVEGRENQEQRLKDLLDGKTDFQGQDGDKVNIRELMVATYNCGLTNFSRLASRAGDSSP